MDSTVDGGQDGVPGPVTQAGPGSWPMVIGHKVLVRQRLQELDGASHVPFVIPRTGAPAPAIAAVEQRWGALEPGYRSFLSHVDGWERFDADGALLGTDALLAASTEADVAEYLTELGVERSVLDPADVMPVSSVCRTWSLALTGRSGTAIAGQVIRWTPHGETARYPRFVDYVTTRTHHEEQALERAGLERVAVRTAARSAHAGLATPFATGSRTEQVRIARTMVADPAAAWAVASVAVCLAALKGALAERGPGEAWGSAPAAAGAGLHDVAAVMDLYGMTGMDSRHAALLHESDGWAGLTPSVDLLSTAQLRDAGRVRPAREHARTVLGAHGLDVDDHLVIGSGLESGETVVLSRTGTVLHLGRSEVVATHPDVRCWLLAVVEEHLSALDGTEV